MLVRACGGSAESSRYIAASIDTMPSFISYLPLFAAAAGSVAAAPAVNTTICNGHTYIYEELAGYGFLASDKRDRYGDSMSLGSSIALDRKTWSRRGNVYEGILYGLPGNDHSSTLSSSWWVVRNC